MNGILVYWDEQTVPAKDHAGDMIWQRLFGHFPASLALATIGNIYTLSVTCAEAAAYRFAGAAAPRGELPNHIRTILACSAAIGIALMTGAILIATNPALRLALASGRLVPLVWPWVDFLKVAGSCAAMAIVVRLPPPPGGLPVLLLKTGVGAVAYVFAALIFDAAGARSALQKFATRRARNV